MRAVVHGKETPDGWSVRWCLADRQETEIWPGQEQVGGTKSTNYLRLEAHESRRK
jgi:hypothetical protein